MNVFYLESSNYVIKLKKNYKSIYNVLSCLWHLLETVGLNLTLWEKGRNQRER